jgi:hypothetical protein
MILRWKMENISSKIRMREGCLLSPLFLKILLDFLHRERRLKKEVKKIQNKKDRSQIISVFRQYDYIHRRV